MPYSKERAIVLVCVQIPRMTLSLPWTMCKDFSLCDDGKKDTNQGSTVPKGNLSYCWMFLFYFDSSLRLVVSHVHPSTTYCQSSLENRQVGDFTWWNLCVLDESSCWQSSAFNLGLQTQSTDSSLLLFLFLRYVPFSWLSWGEKLFLFFFAFRILGWKKLMAFFLSLALKVHISAVLLSIILALLR